MNLNERYRAIYMKLWGFKDFCDEQHNIVMREMEKELATEAAPNNEPAMAGALKNCLGWAAGIQENSKDEASRKVAGWIVERCRSALPPQQERSEPQNGSSK